MVDARLQGCRPDAALTNCGANVVSELPGHFTDGIYSGHVGPTVHEFSRLGSGGPGHTASVDDMARAQA